VRHWLDAGLARVPISVNLAASSLTDPTLLDKLDALMQRFDLAPDNLTLEVTETMVMGDVEHSIGMLERLRAKGYSLSLDDFGTGYSSLSYLKRLTIDELKIDRSFVMECSAGGRDAALAAAIIALGHELGLRIVAEGVETEAQSAFLLRHRCTVQQGYLFARPLTSADFEHLLRQGSVQSLQK
jgi:EAL domain-containing protein (putative c-di-GMP-specific phosphodiesterase class I)